MSLFKKMFVSQSTRIKNPVQREIYAKDAKFYNLKTSSHFPMKQDKERSQGNSLKV